MRSMVFCSAAVLAAAVSLCLPGCRKDDPEAALTPPDYSPHYTQVSVVKPDGREKRVLVPEVCLTPADQPAADYGPERLPPGCANNYNLQQMAARKRDLIKGRPTGAAPAAPAARAAQRYIDGRQEPALGGGVRPEKSELPDAGNAGPSTTTTTQ